MTKPSYVAIRFVHPDFDGHDAPGLRLGASGLQMVEDLASVRQAILLLVSTLPGERVMLPEYGCNLRGLLFQPNDDATAGLAINYVKKAIERWEPRIDLTLVDAEANDDDPARLDIIVQYRLRSTQQNDTLRYPFSLSGGA